MNMSTTDSWRRGAAGLMACAVATLAGCAHSGDTGTAPSSGSPSSSATAPSTSSTGAQFDIGNTVNYTSLGTTTTLDCGKGKSLNVGGSNNTLTIKGTCKTVSIGGADNTITIDKIDSQVNVVGLNNTITFKDGDPKIDNLGSGNSIKKGG